MKCTRHREYKGKERWIYTRCYKLYKQSYHLVATLWWVNTNEWEFEVRFEDEEWKLLSLPWWGWYWIDIPKEYTVKQAEEMADIFTAWMVDLLDSMYDIPLGLKRTH